MTKARTANLDFDAATTHWWMELVRQTVARYFRLEVLDAGNIPRSRCMVVGCHSGVMPYDAACTLAAIEDATGRLARAVGDKVFARFGFVESFLRRRGAIIGRRDEATAILRQGNILLVFPGGAADMTRPIWRDAYRVVPHKGYAPGRGGYIKIALQTRTPIVPLAVVGAEEAHMLLWNVAPVARLLRFPFFPIVAFPFPLPVKISIRFGKPIRFREGPEAADDQAVVDRLNERVRRRVQALIDDTLRYRGGLITR